MPFPCCARNHDGLAYREKEARREKGGGRGGSEADQVWLFLFRVLASLARVSVEVCHVRRNFDDYVYVNLLLTGAHHRTGIVLVPLWNSQWKNVEMCLLLWVFISVNIPSHPELYSCRLYIISFLFFLGR